MTDQWLRSPYLGHRGGVARSRLDEGSNKASSISILELILAHRKAEAEKTINRFEGTPLVQVLNGRYGPFIQIGEGARKNKKNIKIPKGTEPKTLTREDCLALAEAQKK